MLGRTLFGLEWQDQGLPGLRDREAAQSWQKKDSGGFNH
jgi:hypothetical protein